MSDKERAKVVVANELLEEYSVKICMQYDVFMEIDFVNDRYRVISYTEEYCGVIDIQGIFSGLVEKVVREGIHPKDKAFFRCFFDTMRLKKSVSDSSSPIFFEFRVFYTTNRYRWFRAAVVHMNHAHKPVGLCCIVDIGGKKNMRSVENSRIFNAKSVGRYVLTKLHTYQGIKERVDCEISRGLDGAALLCIDIDNFHAVNNHRGRMCGDFLLKFISESLKRVCGSDEWVGRISPDQFVVFLPEMAKKSDVIQCANDVIGIFSANKCIDFKDVELSCSIGVSLYPQDGFMYADLAYNADKALYDAKRYGKNEIVFYSEICED